MSEHDRDSVKDGEDAGEKKVTFNDTTEEKNYTKDREVDEEEKHVEKHVTTSEPIVINTTEKNFESEREVQIKATDKDNEREEKTQFEPRDNNTDEPNQHKIIKDDDKEDEITSENESNPHTHKEDNQPKSEVKTDMQDLTENIPSTRFSKDNDQALSKEMDKTTENYFTDSYTDDDKVKAVKSVKASAKEHVKEKKSEKFDEPTEREFGSSKDQYKSNLVREEEDQTEVTIITKKRGEPPRELDVMTDEDKLKKNKTKDDSDADENQRKSKDEDSYSRDSFIESDADTKSLSKSDRRKSGSESETNEKEKQSQHRSPSPDDSSTYSEPHIITKKTGEIRTDAPKEQEATKTKSSINNGTADTKKSAPNRFESKGGPVKVTPTKQVVVSKKQAVPRKTVNQRAPSAVRSQSPRQIVAQQNQQQPRMAKSAGPAGRQAYSRNASSIASSRSPSKWSRPRTSGYRQEERRRKEKEFFTAELQRLKKSLKEESKKIKKPKERDHYPNVFNSLEPYYNTYTPQYLIQMPDTGYPVKQPPEAEITMKEMKTHRDKSGEDKDLMYTSRCTAIGLCDPWDSLHMDKSVLPKIETSEMRRKRMEKMHEPPKTPSSNKKRPEAKLGSTRLPKFPVINLSNQDLATKELVYTDIPMLRDELVRSFSHNEGGRRKDDYTRTRQDFFRMELDRITEMHKNSQPHMKAAYFAYLQNTPGSRKAVYDCLRELNKKEEKQSPQAVA